MTKTWRYLLLPFSWLYTGVMELRNLMYDHGLLRSIHFDVGIISVGNLTVGGTGKTPMVEMLAAMLSDSRKTALLSRGYGRNTRGFRLASPGDDAATLGDEPYQYCLKFGEKMAVAVGEDRALAIPELLLRHPDTQMIIMDDAYQHRSVARDLDMLLVDFNRPIYRDHVLPAGMLRERRMNARRADVVVVTKCPADLSQADRNTIRTSLAPYTGTGTPVFFSVIDYLPLRPVFQDEKSPDDLRDVVFFSGIADDRPAQEYLAGRYSVRKVLRFPDHFRYSYNNLRQKVLNPFCALEGDACGLVTTEKDMVRILSVAQSRSLFAGVPLYYLPIRMRIVGDMGRFEELIISKTKR